MGTGILSYGGGLAGGIQVRTSLSFPAELYNGRVGGRPAIIARLHSLHATFPSKLPTNVLVFRITRRGTLTRLVSDVPSIESPEFSLDDTSLRLSLHRLYRVDGEMRSYVSAGCPSAEAPFPELPYARIVYAFDDGLEGSGTLAGRCV